MSGKKGYGGVKGRSGRKPGTATIEQLKRYIKNGYFDQHTVNEFSHHIFGDECEVRERFRILNEYFEWFEILNSQTGFPDMTLRDRANNIIRAEIEVTSSHFVTHQHNPDNCDLIICWKHNLNNPPIPVMCIAPEWVNYRQLKKITPKIKI